MWEIKCATGIISVHEVVLRLMQKKVCHVIYFTVSTVFKLGYYWGGTSAGVLWL